MLVLALRTLVWGLMSSLLAMIGTELSDDLGGSRVTIVMSRKDGIFC